MKEPNIITLNNGLKVVFLERREALSVSFCAVVRAGSKYENRNEIGAAHFFEHMLFEGTQKYPDSKTLAWFLEKIGGKSSAWTDKDYVEYSVRVPKGYFERGLEYLSQILFHPMLVNEAVEKEKNIIFEEFYRKTDNSEVEAWEIFMEKTFGKENYLGRSVLGTIEDVKSLNLEKLSDFFNRYYIPSNITLIVIGNFEERAVLQKIKKYFEDVTEGESVTPSTGIANLSKTKIFISKSKDIQSQIALAFITGIKISDEDLWVFKIIRNIFGMGVGSKIIQELVYARGIAYSTGVWNWNYEETGLFCVSAGVSAQNVQQAVNAILNEFRKIKRVLVSKEELTQAINGELAEEYYLHENIENLALNYGLQFVLQNKICSIKDTERKLRAVTSEKIIEAANKYFTNDRLKCVVKGNAPKGFDLNFD